MREIAQPALLISFRKLKLRIHGAGNEGTARRGAAVLRLIHRFQRTAGATEICTNTLRGRHEETAYCAIRG